MNYLIIVAGGQGLRMGGDVPKQFMLLKDRPIIMHTIERFVQAMGQIQTILVLNPDYIELWHDLCNRYSFDYPCTIVNGGRQRFDSVKNGLDAIPDYDAEACVAVHDAVRPLVNIEVIRNAYATAKEKGAVVPVVGSIESVRLVHKDGSSSSIDRNTVMMVQTPQVFSLSILRNAYNQPYNSTFTDDASVVEAYGHRVELIPGNRENIKLTTPIDMKIADVLLETDK